jgi:phage N-6-adenine-methyltransferase
VNLDFWEAACSSATDEWSTPLAAFREFDLRYGPFDLDVCATIANAKCARYFTREIDGLAQVWTGNVWMNPPYGEAIGLWMEKALESVTVGDASQVLCLIPARTDTAWWHDYAMKGQFRFLRGRLKFGNAENSAPFPSALVRFKLGAMGPGLLAL